MSSYTVGFGKPPAETRFKKGQSGNPKGRPKAVSRPRALNDLVSTCLLNEIDVTLGGRRQKKQALEAVILKLTGMALGGDVRAIRTIIDIATKHIPNQVKLEDLMRGKKVIDWTAEDEESLSKENLLKGLPDSS
jgi:hypothetical protein